MARNHRNVVSTVNLGCRLDLKNIALHARNAEYNPKVTSTACCRCSVMRPMLARGVARRDGVVCVMH